MTVAPTESKAPEIMVAYHQLGRHGKHLIWRLACKLARKERQAAAKASSQKK